MFNVEVLFDDLTQFANKKNALTRTIINNNLEGNKEILDYTRRLNSDINMIFDKFLKLPLPETGKEYSTALFDIAGYLMKLHERHDAKLNEYLESVQTALEEQQKGHQMKG